jgi:GTP cyclohydrolase I
MNATHHVSGLLNALGLNEDPETAQTPERFTEFLTAYDPRRPPPTLELLEAKSKDAVVLRDLPFYSLCAHHLLPFFGTVSIAYVPDGRIAGLGGFARVVADLARRTQLQERLNGQIADLLTEQLNPQGLGVRIEARHLCMEMRGAQATGRVETEAWRGMLCDDPYLRTLLGAP